MWVPRFPSGFPSIPLSHRKGKSRRLRRQSSPRGLPQHPSQHRRPTGHLNRKRQKQTPGRGRGPPQTNLDRQHLHHPHHPHHPRSSPLRHLNGRHSRTSSTSGMSSTSGTMARVHRRQTTNLRHHQRCGYQHLGLLARGSRSRFHRKTLRQMRAGRLLQPKGHPVDRPQDLGSPPNQTGSASSPDAKPIGQRHPRGRRYLVQNLTNRPRSSAVLGPNRRLRSISRSLHRW